MLHANSEHSLLVIIKSLREEMIRIGNSEGLSNEQTLKVSQKLDYYILKYQKLIHRSGL
ncbi:hypothetical protein J2Z40_002079 [Cytobacillus eiseniae]|uniref:Aspartyl-phosphate phosphatase Spo0E family protein n=1 Tax=Cytobacillus eiseniae TaxID=762947 RepID=A0ABS4RF28_9BACI|nr:aspartyl-phosphate phosphatase Spo0E family protein [Cytobacillus eiseniae]MBP2241516.1 hypothetical protein [Cytobacillus eiseniae]